MAEKHGFDSAAFRAELRREMYPGPQPYRILVTGSRDWEDENRIAGALLLVASRVAATRSITIVHGDCLTGADAIAHRVALHYEWCPEPHPADWPQHGKAAGPIRNAEMVALGADVCLAFFREGAANKGTSNCVALAEKAGILVLRIEDAPKPDRDTPAITADMPHP